MIKINRVIKQALVFTCIFTAGIVGGYYFSYLNAKNLACVTLLDIREACETGYKISPEISLLDLYFLELDRYEAIYGKPPLNVNIERLRVHMRRAEFFYKIGDIKNQAQELTFAKDIARKAGLVDDIEKLSVLLREESKVVK